MERFDAVHRAISSRVSRQQRLTISLDKMLYADRAFLSDARFRRALYVGVGHGHDAILPVIDDRIAEVDGVDPYYASQGNDNTDYEQLLSLLSELGIESRFQVHRMRIEEFIADTPHRYDLIVLPDVLHHIFVTRSPLSQSEHFQSCVDLFRSLLSVASPGGTLAISEAPRFGLRPLLVNLGLLKDNVKYRTKQESYEWRSAAEAAGWRLRHKAPYVPYSLRAVAPLLRIPPAPRLYSTRYFMWFDA